MLERRNLQKSRILSCLNPQSTADSKLHGKENTSGRYFSISSNIQIAGRIETTPFESYPIMYSKSYF